MIAEDCATGDKGNYREETSKAPFTYRWPSNDKKMPTVKGGLTVGDSAAK